jgi:uncharacterized membrane protein YccC
VPLGALAASHHTAVGSAAALGALFVSFGDTGSAVRRRVQTMGVATMGVATMGGALLFALGRSIGHVWWLAAPVVFLAALAAGIVVVYGSAAVTVGLILTIAFVSALGTGGGPAAAVASAVGFAIGGLSALLLALAPGVLRRRQRAATTPPQAAARRRRPLLAPLLAALTFSSPTLRFAALRAAGATAAGSIIWLLGVSYPQWAVLPVLLGVRPDRDVSLVTTVRRVVGTILGAVVADLVIVAVHDLLIRALLAVAVMVLAFTVRNLNDALFIGALTLMTLLLISIPTAGRSLASRQVLETLVGATIALAVTWLGTWASGLAAANDAPT